MDRWVEPEVLVFLLALVGGGMLLWAAPSADLSGGPGEGPPGTTTTEDDPSFLFSCWTMQGSPPQVSVTYTGGAGTIGENDDVERVYVEIPSERGRTYWNLPIEPEDGKSTIVDEEPSRVLVVAETAGGEWRVLGSTDEPCASPAL